MKPRMGYWILLVAFYAIVLMGCDSTPKQASIDSKTSVPELQDRALVGAKGSQLDPGMVEPIFALDVNGLNRGGKLQIYSNGVVEISQWGNMPNVPRGQSSISDHYTLPPETVSRLIDQFRKAKFSEFQDRYIQQDPPNVAAEYDWETLTFSDNGQVKSISIRGWETVPSTLIELRKELDGFWNRPTPHQ